MRANGVGRFFAAIFAAALLLAPAVGRAADVLAAPSPPPAAAAVVVPELYDPTRWEVRFGGFAHDAVTLPIVEQIAPRLTTVEKYIVLAAEDRMPETKLPVLCYETLLAQEAERDLAWPRFDENSASTICFTSGTTGNPKGFVYSHRAAVLQTLLAGSFDFLPGHQSGVREVMMPMAPLFHGNAWNFPFLAPYTGSKLVLPGRNYEL